MQTYKWVEVDIHAYRTMVIRLVDDTRKLAKMECIGFVPAVNQNQNDDAVHVSLHEKLMVTR